MCSIQLADGPLINFVWSDDEFIEDIKEALRYKFGFRNDMEDLIDQLATRFRELRKLNF